MTAKLRLVFAITILFASFWGYSQDNYWTAINKVDSASNDFIKESDFSKSSVFSIDDTMLKSKLKQLSASAKNETKLYFPDEAGVLRAYLVRETPVFAAELAAKYPQIKSYSGIGVEDSQRKVRFSISHNGLQAMMVHPEKATASFIQKTSKNTYVVYERNGLAKKDTDFICETKSSISANKNISTNRPVSGMVLRKYRLAVSASGNYTEFHGGTVADALAAINASMTRINQIFEVDLGVTLELIANNDELIFTNPETDPYTSGDSLNAQAQTTITNRIGEANYDIGHLFHQGGSGGNAGFIGAICSDGQKGSAYSSGSTPVGDVFDIDFVAHELGHQLGANHTWSFESEGTSVQVEPGSGTTIMGYAGITQENNVALNSDAYFHYVSILQIVENLDSKSCGEAVSLTNNPPVVNAVPNYVIPALTAFKLTGDATDPDAGDQLTYVWEHIDNGVVTQGSFGPENPVGANFRSKNPTADPSRYFPALARVVSGNLTQTTPSANSAWETITSLGRVLNFALTVRDNAAGGGQVVSELVEVEVNAGGAPFSVSSQASNINYAAGELIDVNWIVGNTDQAPINVQTVDILLSIDGGSSFPVMLAQQVLNNGSHQVVLPGSATSEARIMVRANDNIFYAVNAADFVITESAIVLNPTQTTFEACQPDAVMIPFTYETYAGFAEEVSFTVPDLPVGLSATFVPATATADDTQVTLTIGNTANVELGEYAITVRAAGGSETKELPLQLMLFGSDFADINLLSPVDGAVDVSASGNFEWEASTLYSTYEIQIATDAAFATIVETAVVSGNTYAPTGLSNDTAYFWRLKPINTCGEGTFGPGFGLTTIKKTCIPSRLGTDLPIDISVTGTPTISSKITFFDDFVLSDIEVGIELDHTYLSDLVITLTAPSGKSVRLLSNSCGNLSNINAVFNDSAANFMCDGDPAISGTVRPLIGFDSFIGDSIAGEWTLTIEDQANEDGGVLKNFFLNVCVEGEPLPDGDADGVFDADDACPGTPLGTNVDVTGCPIYRFAVNNFQLQATSESCRNENDGILEIATQESLDYSVTITGNGLNVSDTFTTSYIQNNLSAGTYTVCFNATDGTKVYEEACFEVVISEPEALSVSSRIGVDPNSIVLSLGGSDIYTIAINGLAVQTTKSEYTLDLKPGTNLVKVTGTFDCQGSFEESFFIPSGIIVYPNPTTDFVKIYVENSSEVKLNLFSIEGRLIRSEKRIASASEVEFDISTLSAGTYLLQVDGQSQRGTYKIIKQ